MRPMNIHLKNNLASSSQPELDAAGPMSKRARHYLNMAAAHASVSELSPVDHHALELQMAEERGQSNLCTQSEIADLTRKNRLLRFNGVEQRKLLGTPNNVSEEPFTSEELDAAAEHYESEEVQQIRTAPHVGGFGDAPKAPDAEEQAIWNTTIESLPQAPEPDTPWWAREICRNRDKFRNCAISTSTDANVYWLCVIEKQQPHEATFLELRRLPLVLSMDAGDTGASRSTGAILHKQEYEFLPPVMKIEKEMDITNEDEIFVRTGLCFHTTCIVSLHDPVDFERFIIDECGKHINIDAQPRAAPKRRPRPLHSDRRQELLALHDWMSDDDLPPLPPPRRPRVPPAPGIVEPPVFVDSPEYEPTDPGDESDDPEMPVLEDVEAEVASGVVPLASADAVARHEAIRDALAWGEDTLYFKPRTLGGIWTGEHLGVGANAYGGFARTKLCKEWCDRVGFPKQAVHAFVKYNGQDNAANLSNEYCRRGEFFYVKFLMENDLAYRFTQADVDEYEESAVWLEFICNCDTPSTELERALVIRTWSPRVG